MKKKCLYILVGLDLLWSVLAFNHDWPKFAIVPAWAWVFAFICPIYPLLLAVVWAQIINKKHPNDYLLAFAVGPSMIFGVLALLFYPLAMAYQGFDWNGLGQIFWVAFYSIQGWYLFYKIGVSKAAFAFAGVFLATALSLDYRFKGFGYFNLDQIADLAIKILFIIALLLLALVWSLELRKKKS